MDHRTKDQCYQRYRFSLRDDLLKGAFSEQEDFMIMVGVKIFGENWAKIGDFMPNRTPMQLHSRYKTFLSVKFTDWSPREDYKLLELVKSLGTSDWVKVANGLPGKTRTQCRTRFQV